jgi:hypothetical protein
MGCFAVFAVAIALFEGTHARTNAGGPCTSITNKRECCASYDSRITYEAASHCVWSSDKFSDGSQCEAEAAIVLRNECALVGSCQAHVQMASSSCLGLVLDKVSITGQLTGPWIGTSEQGITIQGLRYVGQDLQLKKVRAPPLRTGHHIPTPTRRFLVVISFVTILCAL